MTRILLFVLVMTSGCAAGGAPRLADPFKSPEIPEIYETAPNVSPPAK